MVPIAGIEPARLATTDFQFVVSTISTIWANKASVRYDFCPVLLLAKFLAYAILHTDFQFVCLPVSRVRQLKNPPATAGFFISSLRFLR